MLRGIRKRISPATVIATVALVFAMTGGAYAAGKILITSTKQISPKVLKSLKGATGKAGATGAAGPAGPAGSAGPAGPAGAAGSGTPGVEGKQGVEGKEGKEGKTGKEGKERKSGFTETLPSGKTETGTWAFDRQEGGLGGERVPISFPIPLSAALGEGQVHLIAANGKELVFSEIGEPAAEVAPTKCGTPVGTVAKPAATAGNLCIYISKLNPAKVELEQVASQFIVDPSAECELIGCLEAFGGPGGGAAPSGAVFESLVQVGEPANGLGTWAVTAP
jgi:hypothetical protein